MRRTIHLHSMLFFVPLALDVGPDGKVTYEKKEPSK